MTRSGRRRRRVLFVAEAVSLAHVGRPLSLAASLDPSTFDVGVATAERYESYVRAVPGVSFHRLDCIPPSAFLARVSAGEATYHRDELDAYVVAEQQLFAAVQPDLVVADFRWTVPISAGLAEVTHAAIVNAHWSPGREPDDADADADADAEGAGAPPSRPPGAAARVRRAAGRLARSIGARRESVGPGPLLDVDTALMNEVRAAHGLAPLADWYDLVSAGTFTLYPEPPGFVPLRFVPDGHRFLGPVLWSPPVDVPPWWSSIDADRPMVYITLGSTGSLDHLAAIVERVSVLPVTVVVATAERTDMPSAPNVFVATFLPGERVCRAASVVVGNGGSATAYQALAAGRPVVGVWSNPDQQQTASLIERAGAGVAVPNDERTVDRVVDAVRLLLDDGSYRAAAEHLGRHFADHDPALAFPAFVRDALAMDEGADLDVDTTQPT